MEHIIDELLEMMDDKIEDEYSNMDSIVSTMITNVVLN